MLESTRHLGLTASAAAVDIRRRFRPPAADNRLQGLSSILPSAAFCEPRANVTVQKLFGFLTHPGRWRHPCCWCRRRADKLKVPMSQAQPRLEHLVADNHISGFDPIGSLAHAPNGKALPTPGTRCSSQARDRPRGWLLGTAATIGPCGKTNQLPELRGMSDLVVLDFDGIGTADEVLTKLRAMQKEHLIDLEDGCVVVHTDKGKVQIKQALNLTAFGAARGASAGMLVGALTGLLLLNPLAGMAVGGLTGMGVGALSGSLADYG